MEGMERGGGENTSIKKWLMIPGDQRSDVWGTVIARARWERKSLGTEKKVFDLRFEIVRIVVLRWESEREHLHFPHFPLLNTFYFSLSLL